MSATVDWTCIEPGVYRARYRGRLLEILRNGNAYDKRRYECAVDGAVVTQPCHTVPQAKTKLIKHVTRTLAGNGADRPVLEPLVEQAVVRYEAPAAPADVHVEMTYVITGTMRVPDFNAGWNHLTTTIEMLREWGEAHGEAVPPQKVRF